MAPSGALPTKPKQASSYRLAGLAGGIEGNTMSNNPLESDPKRDERIRERAFHLWQADGEPHGRDAEYWERASELVGMAESAGAGQVAPVADTAHRIDGQIVDEAALQDNLGEFPGRQEDQGERRPTPAKRNRRAK